MLAVFKFVFFLNVWKLVSYTVAELISMLILTAYRKVSVWISGVAIRLVYDILLTRVKSCVVKRMSCYEWK
jgi:hypothetical protein